MPNMSYCRFSNTLSDLEDCLENICELLMEEGPSESELAAAARMRELCEEFVEEYDTYAV